ncbi:MAG: hypothetical protein AAGC61_14350, partial [Microbacterium sp.]
SVVAAPRLCGEDAVMGFSSGCASLRSPTLGIDGGRTDAGGGAVRRAVRTMRRAVRRTDAATGFARRLAAVAASLRK